MPRVAAIQRTDNGATLWCFCFVFFSVQEECQNYIRVLLVNGNRLFTCGTNAFTPICTNRTVRTPFVLYLCLHERRPHPEALPEASDKPNMSFLATVVATHLLRARTFLFFFISAAQMHVEVFTR